MTHAIQTEVQAAVKADRKRALAIIAAGARLRVSATAVGEAILSGTHAEEFTRSHKVEILARRIALS